MWIKDPKTSKKSVTVSILVATFIMASAKLLLAGLTFKDLTFGSFEPSGWALMMTTAAGLYWGRKHTDKDK